MARESFNIVPYIVDGGGAMVSRSTDPANIPEIHKIGENEYQIMCVFLRDVIGGTQHGRVAPQPPAYTITLSPAGGTIAARKPGGTTHNHILGVWAQNAFVALCELVEKGKKDSDFKYVYGAIFGNGTDPDRAWSDGVAAVIAEIGHWEGSEITGREIHQAWYQGMTMQGREVPIERRTWETLPDADRELDIHIARVFLQQMAINLDTEVRAQRASTDGADRTAGDDPRASIGDDARDFIMLRGKYARQDAPDPGYIYTDQGIDPIIDKRGAQILHEFLGVKVAPPPSDPPTRMPEYLYRQIETEGKSAESLAFNLTNNELAQLVIDVRKDRDDARARHGQSEDLRRKDNAAWNREIDQHNATRQTLNELRGDHEAMAIELVKACETMKADRQDFNDRRNQLLDQIDGQAREITKLEETIASQEDQIGRKNEALAERDQLRKVLDAEIVKLNSRLQSTRDVVNAEIAKAEIAKQEIKMTPGLPFDQRDDIGWDFARQMTEAPLIGGAFMGVAAIGAELASVRTMSNNRSQREIDPVGFGKRLATIAGYALQLYREDCKGDPIVAKDSQPS